jgi:beta-1,4-mannosyltransferase
MTELTIGSWPGRAFTRNAFIGQFIRALESGGAIVKDVDDPRRCQPEDMDLLLIHWPEEIFWRGTSRIRSIQTAAETIFALRKLRRQGVKLVWLIHNLKPHGGGSFRRIIWRIYSRQIARLINGYLTLSPGTIGVVKKTFSLPENMPCLAFRHPPYDVDYPLPSRASARQQFNVPDSPRVLALAGVLKHYKGADTLAQCVSALGRDICSVIIAGRAKQSDLRLELEAIAAQADNVLFREGQLSDADFVSIMRAADYVVLPFREILHSGSLIHALSIGRPVLTPRTGFSEDLANVVGTDWVRLYDGKFGERVLRALPPPPTGEPDLSALAAQPQAGSLLFFLRSIVHPAPHRG